MKKINEQIQWYDKNSTRKDDELIKANLKLIDNLYSEIENSEDKIFVDKIISTFCEIMETQRDVINELEAESWSYNDSTGYVYTNQTEFTDDKQLQEAFTSFCLKSGKSSYTVNDYCSRIKKSWKAFLVEYQQGTLAEEIEVNEEIINPNTPLLNAYHHIEELHCYISMRIATAQGNRNWANTRAAFNKFDDFKDTLSK